MATTLKGGEVYTAITIRDAKMSYRADSRMSGQHYHSGSWGTRGFTVSPQLYQDWRDGKIKELSIEEASYEREDTATGQKAIVQSATITGYMTFDRAINVLKYSSLYNVEEAKSEITTKHAKLTAIAELGLDEKSLKMLEQLA